MCSYDKDKKSNVPWSCEVCNCISDKWGKCKKIEPVKRIYTVYPDYLLTGVKNKYVEFIIPPGIDVKRDKFHENLLCGDEKDFTLKFTPDGNALVIKKPEGVSVISKDGVNPNLWARKVYSTNFNNTRFQIQKDVDKELDLKHLLEGSNVHFEDYYRRTEGAIASYPVEVIWKDEWYDEYKDNKITKDNPYKGSLTKDVCPPAWGYEDYLREWVSNAFDVTPDGKVDLYVDENNSLVLDYDSPSPLLPKYLLLLGKREKHKGSIGKFGEGIKQATTGFIRDNEMMKIETIGWTYYPVFRYDDFTGEYVLHTWHMPNDRKKGTKVTILNVPEPQNLIDETKKMFLRWRDVEIVFDDGKNNQILSKWKGDPENSNCISVRGVRTDIIEGHGGESPMLFNYNFYNNELMNRDRKFVGNIGEETKEVVRKLGEEEYYIIKSICDSYDRTNGKLQDLNIDWGYEDDEPEDHLDHPELWEKAIEEVFTDEYGDKKIVIKWGEDFKEKNLVDLGWQLVDWGSGNWLLRQFGYKIARDYPESIGEPKKVGIMELSMDELAIYDAARDNLELVMREYYKLDEDDIKNALEEMYVASSFEGVEEAERGRQSGVKVWGLCEGGRYMPFRDKKIYILRDALDTEAGGSIEKATGILIHEFIHKKTGYRDEKREFENVMTELLGFTGARWKQIRDAMKDEYSEFWMPEAIVIEYAGEPWYEYKKPEVKISGPYSSEKSSDGTWYVINKESGNIIADNLTFLEAEQIAEQKNKEHAELYGIKATV